MKPFLFLICSIFLINLKISAQIEEVNYSVEYNEENKLYDLFLHIIKGSTRQDESRDRIQFNSQISLVSHVGVELNIVERYLPLEDNLNYDGTIPMGWQIFNSLKSPEEAPGSNFYSISPKLAPTSYYPEMKEGDKLKLFSIDVSPLDTCTFKLRLFDNEVDKIIGTGHGDYSNGFTLGGVKPLYTGNIEDTFVGGNSPQVEFSGSDELYVGESTTLTPNDGGEWHSSNEQVVTITNYGVATGLSEGTTSLYFAQASENCISAALQLEVKLPANIENAKDDLFIYPNPTSGLLNIKSIKKINSNSISIFDINGNRVQLKLINQKIDLTSLAEGIYIIKIQLLDKVIIRKINKIN